MLRVLNNTFDDRQLLEERAVAPLAGGIIQHGYQCGMIWGAVLAAGAQIYERFGSCPEAESRAILAAQRLVKAFQSCTGEIDCYEITELNRSATMLKMLYVFFIKGKTISCFWLSGRYAPLAYKEINAVLAEDKIKIPSQPVSCAAELARKMGATEKQVVMAAGLAGGIGLCGGACGALGAAIWIMTMNKGLEEKLDFKDPKTLELIEKTFLTVSDNKFRCEEIVGKKFKSVDDHAEYMHTGGCSKLIEALVEKQE